MDTATPSDTAQAHENLRACLAGIDAEVRFDDGSRSAYSTDASNFRQVPIGVVIPKTVDDGAAALRICRDFDVPVLSRAGGTSLAGQCTNEAIVIDWTKYCHRLVSVDPQRRTCVVEPGIVLDSLNAQLAEYGLRFGPEPATHMNCTLGGMIGNNSCGATAQRTGKTVDNVTALEVMLYDGARFWCGPTDDEQYRQIESRGDRRAAVYRGMRRIRDQYAETIRATFPDIPRRVSGYNLDSLLDGFDLAGLLVGSESTLATVLQAELSLVPVLPERTLVVLGYDDIVDAARAVPRVVSHEPVALEGVDRRLIHDEQLKGMNPQALAQLPSGTGFLMVQFAADTHEEAEQAAEAMLADLGDSQDDASVAFYSDPAREDELWAVREAGLGATAHLPGRRDTWEGWEDSAVPPDQLASYLQDLRALFDEFGYLSDTGPALYGHFGQGCVHTRIPFDLFSAEGVALYRRFMERAAALVVSYGGSLSGEHGDGQSRGELLTTMFGHEIVEAFERTKTLFDPGSRMNPGKVVQPAALDEHLRLGQNWSPAEPQDLFFSFSNDGGSFSQAVTRCVGVGRCRQPEPDGEVMCPSYQVTGEEEHSTRGRARLLFEMMNGHSDGQITDGWKSTEVRDALDLCLACKGCLSDCPASVDMATYKAEFLAHHYQGRLRPRSHYALGWLPTLARLVDRTDIAALANKLSGSPRLRALAAAVAGLEDREFPRFAAATLRDQFSRRSPIGAGNRGTVMIFPDTFTNYFAPHIGIAAADVLERAGWRVTLPEEPVCCGLTWISTGQLTHARSVLGTTVQTLARHVRDGGLVVGPEPSCTAVFRHDAPDLLHANQDVQRLRDSTLTLAELLHTKTPGWEPPGAGGLQTLAQVHCHQHAVMGWQEDNSVLQSMGVDSAQMESGCCGLAGNFGFTRGHGKVSRDLAHQVMVPRIEASHSNTTVLADGFSCRTQIHEFASDGREGIHLAELIDRLETAHSTSDT